MAMTTTFVFLEEIVEISESKGSFPAPFANCEVSPISEYDGISTVFQRYIIPISENCMSFFLKVELILILLISLTMVLMMIKSSKPPPYHFYILSYASFIIVYIFN